MNEATEKIKIAICDDEEDQRSIVINKIKEYGKRHDTEFQITEYGSGFELRKDFYAYDFIVLDVDMPKYNGLQLAADIRSEDPLIPIMYITNYKHYAYQSFQVNPVGYLMKNEPYEIFEQQFRKALLYLEDNHRQMTLSYRNQIYKIKAISISYVEYYKREVTIHLINGQVYHHTGTLQNFMRMEGGEILLKIQRGVAVNVRRIKAIDSTSLYLAGEERKFEIPRGKGKTIYKEWMEMTMEEKNR